MGDHFARPTPYPNGATPTHGDQTCRTCGQPIQRRGQHFASDGVRGQWRHIKPKNSSATDETDR